MEGKAIEYKRELTKDVEGLEKEVVSFLNTYGGEIIFGLADDGTLYGVPAPDDVQKRIAQRLSENVLPSCLGLFDIDVESAEGGKHLVKVIVSSGADKPYYIAKYGMSPKGCHYRVGSTCRPMPENMIRELYAKRVPTTLKNIVSPDQELSFNVLKIYYEGHGHILNEQFAKTLDFLTPDGKYNFIAYLFSDNNHLSFKVARYAGTDKCDLLETSEYGFCCLLKVADRILDRLIVENRTWTRITPKFRLEKKMFEPVPSREALINMLVHNDYTHGYTPVVELFSDRLEMTSIGGLPAGLSEKDFFSGVSLPRNREIMRIFKDVEMVEELGSGMNRILKSYDKSIFKIADSYIRVSFKYVMGIDEQSGISSQNFNQSTKWTDNQSTKRTDVPSRKVASTEALKADMLSFIRENPSASYQQIGDGVGIGRSTTGKYLKQMIEAGLLKRMGNNKSGYWKIF